ncbi:MAG: Na+/galactose cotransporter, partial [Brachybacterium sp.]|nr:Na+/galactose cotransporter [Brachybacterium sp.]
GFELPGQGLAFRAAATAVVVDIVVSVVVTQFTAPKPVHELKGLVYSETPKADLVDPEEAGLPFWRRPVPMAGIALVLVLALNFLFV